MRDTNPPDGISRPGIRLAATAVFGLVACGACAPEAPSWTGTIEERDGVVHVTNPAEPLWPSDREPRLRLELEQVFGVDEEPAEAMLARAQDLAIDDSGNVYVLDSGDDRIVAFDAEGAVLWGAGRGGEGPRELTRPRGIASDGERLYVLNQAGTRLDWWTTDGEYGDQFRLAGIDITSASSLGFLSPDRLALVVSGVEVEVVVVDPGAEWARVDAFVVDGDGVSLGGPAAMGGVTVRANEVATGSIRDYRFRIYRGDGQLERVVERPGTGFVPVAIDEERRAIAFMGSIEPPVRLESGHLLTQGAWPPNIDDPAAWIRLMVEGADPPAREYRHVLDLFDREGRWVTGLAWDHPDRPDHGTVHSIGPDGKLYTVVTDPFPQVRRYRVASETSSRAGDDN